MHRYQHPLAEVQGNKGDSLQQEDSELFVQIAATQVSVTHSRHSFSPPWPGQHDITALDVHCFNSS
jgi:hypothetical protein